MTMRMKGPRRVALLLAAAAMTSCGGGSSGGTTSAVTPTPTATPTPAARPASVERLIAPNTTDAALSVRDGDHVAINPDPAVAPKGRLFVMLPGTGGVPRNLRDVTRAAGPRGYHAVGIAYPNDTAVGDLCAGNADLNCTGNVRREIITGADLSPLVSIDVANSIAGRLTRLLSYLARTYPTEGWQAFIPNGNVDWSLVTMAGHSQGSGHAAYMGKLYSLDRIVMFSGPSDIGQVAGTTAQWLSLPNVTPASRQYGFTHTGDELVPLALVQNNWTLLGLGAFGASVSVDGATAPYGNSHQLITSAAPNPNPAITVTYPRHLSTAIDTWIPVTTGGTLVYTPTWIYLAFP
jgi:hypothetical protein